jgi:hypothetical protein
MTSNPADWRESGVRIVRQGECDAGPLQNPASPGRAQREISLELVQGPLVGSIRDFANRTSPREQE